MSKDLPEVPFNILTATEEEIEKEMVRRPKEKKRVQDLLKKYKQHYSNTPAACPGDAIDCPESYKRLKMYYDEVNTSVTYQEMLAEHLRKLESKVAELSGFDILQEIENVLRLRIPCPDWLYFEFQQRFSIVAKGEAKGFGDDGSFGVMPAGKSLTNQIELENIPVKTFRFLFLRND